MEQKIDHKIIGMERSEIINEKTSIEESIKRLINSVVTTNIENYSVSINLKNFIRISIVSKQEMDLELNKEVDITQNLLLMSLAKIGENATVIIKKKGIIKKKIFDLKNIDDSMLQETIIYNDKDITDNKLIDEITKKHNNKNYNLVIFKMYKNDLKEETIEFINERRNIKKIKSYFKNSYYNGIINGFKINISNDKVSVLNYEKGKLVNPKSCKINNNKYVRIYRDKEENKRVELWINNVKVSNKYLDSLIEWNKEPFRKNGYSFKRLFIEVSISKNGFNLNDKKSIQYVSKKVYKEVKNEVRKSCDAFKNDYVNINLQYKRDKMNKILEKTYINSSAKATELVLDNYFESLTKVSEGLSENVNNK